MTAADLQTIAEKSQFRQTGRLDEVEALAETFTRAWPDAVRSFEYGRSGEGRIMRALVVSKSGALSPDEIKRRGIPLLYLQGGVHPGESDGKDAGFISLRDILQGSIAPDVLDNLAVLFVPAFNADGHERFACWNRPNQRGPEETGWRTTSRNLNLNRDYTKAEEPEMQAMLRLINEWDPLICGDLHVTDGADFEPDISLQAEPIHIGDERLRPHGVQLRDELIVRLAAQGSLPLPFYPDFVEQDNPASGFQLTVYTPRFSTGYYAMRNRLTVLVEVHSWKDYPTRVRVMRNTCLGLIELAAKHGKRWLADAKAADAEDLRGKEVVLDMTAGWNEPTRPGVMKKRAAVPDASIEMIDYRGYAYTRDKSNVSGDLVTVYDPATPQIWRVPFRRQLKPAAVVATPRGGYVIPAGYAELIGGKLALHGIAAMRLGKTHEKANVEVFRANEVNFAGAPFEGRTRVKLAGAWSAEQQTILAGSLFVPTKQALARLAMALLEPTAADSLAAWGFFNSCFEMKESFEPYVAEQIAREMLARDPQCAAEFKTKLANDPAFAASPAARLEFFNRRHESWDERYNLYPIFRTDHVFV
ncbi:MAG TPA: M14 family zinc carboxypeptidase [Dongiaceae bacterium]